MKEELSRKLAVRHVLHSGFDLRGIGAPEAT
jgi:hypothetical protein